MSSPTADPRLSQTPKTMVDEATKPGAPGEALVPPVVELVNLSRTFPGDPPVDALRSATLSIPQGGYVSIVGPSGSGKSTLLHLLGLLDQPTGGVYRLDGIDVASLSDSDSTALRGQRIGFVFQSFHLLQHRTVVENVELAMLYNRYPRQDRRDAAVDALTRVGLDHRLGFRPSKLSGGEQQRVAIARAIVAAPSLLLADEPTGNLDQKTGESVLEVFDELNQRGLTVIVITHDPAVAERAARTVSMLDGVMTEQPR